MSEHHSPRHPDELREAIDRGEGSDKVAHPDPAAAPLGTDEEAGGTPTSPEAVETAFRQEIHETARSAPRGAGSRGLLLGLWVAFGLVVGVFLGFVVWQFI